jgi:hypothetical protein
MKTQLGKPILWIGMSCLFACGDGGQPQVVQKFVYDVSNDTLDLSVQLSKDLSLNTDFVVPIKNYGELRVTASNPAQGVTIGGKLNVAAFLDPAFIVLERTRKLPNNQPMSSYITTDVARLRIKIQDQVASSVYLGTDSQKMYFGTAIELGFMGANFPQGLVISQYIRDTKQRMLGVITVYGPEIQNGQVIHPGGIFLMTNITDLAGYIKAAKGTQETFADRSRLYPDDSTYINEPYRRHLSNPRNLYNLMQTYKQDSKNAGLSN